LENLVLTHDVTEAVSLVYNNLNFIAQQIKGDKARAANSVFINLWLDVKHSTLNRFFLLLWLIVPDVFSYHNFINTLTLAAT